MNEYVRSRSQKPEANFSASPRSTTTKTTKVPDTRDPLPSDTMVHTQPNYGGQLVHNRDRQAISQQQQLKICICRMPLYGHQLRVYEPAHTILPLNNINAKIPTASVPKFPKLVHTTSISRELTRFSFSFLTK